jgi:hypothetical protein
LLLWLLICTKTAFVLKYSKIYCFLLWSSSLYFATFVNNLSLVL